MAEQTTRSQTVDFLGFLRGQLSGLQGIPTLCYELIQNADDVKDNAGNPGGASRISFAVCDDALYVENDGVFRDIDYDRMQRVSWGNKREEADTTGAFGLGFISVYQVTDSPEIFSSGEHWKFQPYAGENERILVTKQPTENTRFRLPWAFVESDIRKELRIPPISIDQLDGYTDEICHAVDAAALFLKQITVLEVKRRGQLVYQVETLKEGDWLLVLKGTQPVKWRILQGDFHDSAFEMRKRYGGLIEEKRKSVIKIAIPEEPIDNGLLYAFLPSETRTGLPFHINADFYPSQDRKRILFEQTFQSEWNNLAIACAAETLASGISHILELFTPKAFWGFAERVKIASESNILSTSFSAFWENLKPQIRSHPTILTTAGRKVTPPSAVYLDTDPVVQAGSILEDLGIDTVHSDLRGSRNILVETGVRLIKINDIVQGFSNKDLKKRTELRQAPGNLQTKAAWKTLWACLNDLWNRASTDDRERATTALAECAIAFGSDGALWPPASLFAGNADTREIFANLRADIWFDDRTSASPLPTELVPEFGLEEGLQLLEEVEETLLGLWNKEIFLPRDIYVWLEGLRSEIQPSPYLIQQIRELSIWPTSDGLLKPLENLYLAGDFEDPLKLTALVDIEELGGRREFLETVLQVSELDFVTYVEDFVPSILESGQLDQEKQLGLILVLSENLGKLQGNTHLQSILSGHALVWCGENQFQPAVKVYFDSPTIRDVLGIQISVAQFPKKKKEAVQALYEWLGVSKEPRSQDIVNRIRALVASVPTQISLKGIDKIFNFLATQWNLWDVSQQRFFEILKRIAWLPGTKKRDEWFKPENVYSSFLRYLFESQGNFLTFDLQVQQKANKFLDFIGIESEPLPAEVVRHLLHSCQHNKSVNQEVYTFLNRNVSDNSIQWLIGESCLYLRAPTGEERYFRPDQVFWEDHPFGTYRFRLGHEFGKFKNLFDRLGVRAKAEAQDAINVLLEISNDFGSSNIPITKNEDIESIVIQCWRLLSEAIEQEAIESDVIRKALAEKKTIPNTSQHLLCPPGRLFFEDRPGWSSKFIIITNNLAKRVEGAWLAMEAAGVRRLSKAITTEMIQCLGRQEDEHMKALLKERRMLIQRVIESHRNKGVIDFELTNLEDLTFMKADEIEVIRIFTGFKQREKAPLETVDAVHIDGTLYYSVNGDYPWKGIARELSFVLHPTGELSSLGMELKEIFSQSLEDAIGALDEYGYPRIESSPEPQKSEQEVKPTGSGSNSTLEGDPEIRKEDGESKGEDQEDKDGRKDGHPGSTGKKEGDPEKRKPPKRKTSRLISYVYPEDTEADPTKKTDPGSSERRTRIGQIGVALVMEYEREQERTPTDMETVQVHYPGYDVKSIDAMGRVRYIEVKTLSGVWDSQNPAQMTKTEFETSQELGTSYWLYVVEMVETEDRMIHQIPNPGGRVNYYLFDHGWKPTTNEL